MASMEVAAEKLLSKLADLFVHKRARRFSRTNREIVSFKLQKC